MLFKASAPGRVTLLGEHAVLHHYCTLVAAIDKRIRVYLSPSDHANILIQSNLGSFKTSIFSIDVVSPFKFVLATLKKYQPYFQKGCTLTIESDFSDQIGLGSSAAVTVAVLAALNSWFNLKLTALEMVKAAHDIVIQVQGVGSGADIAASVYGGMVHYGRSPLKIEKIPFPYPFSIIYSGFKTPTVEVINQVNNNFSSNPQRFKQFMAEIGDLTDQGVSSIRQKDWKTLGKVMTQQQAVMEQLGVSTPLITTLVNSLCQKSNILGAKISGAGLGDCVIALGHVENDFIFPFQSQGVQLIPLTLSEEGVYCEKI